MVSINLSEAFHDILPAVGHAAGLLNIYETILNVIQKSAWGRLDVDLHALYRLKG